MKPAITSVLVIAVVLAADAVRLEAHETRPAYLEVIEASAGQWSVLWKSPTRGDPPLDLHPMIGGRALETRPGRCTDLGAAGSNSSAVVCQWEVPAAGASLAGQRVTIDGLAATATDVLVQITFADGATEARLLKPSEPSWTIERGGGRSIPAGGFFRLGVEHILYGIDHLLFVLLLVLVVGGSWSLVKTVTAFTVAHTLTLGAAVLGFVRVATAPVEAVIALSILFLASEVADHRDDHAGLTYRAPWIVALSFGLLHGFGFAGALSTVGLSHADIPLALLFFNLGVEAGQLAFIVVVLGVLGLVRRASVPWPGWTSPIPAYVIGSVAAFWFLERSAQIFH